MKMFEYGLIFFFAGLLTVLESAFSSFVHTKVLLLGKTAAQHIPGSIGVFANEMRLLYFLPRIKKMP